jgi:hypothetical protein
MRFHDVRGMLPAWHEFWEEQGCEAQKRERPWPVRMDSRHVSALLYMEWAKAGGLREDSILEGMVEEPSGEIGMEEPREYIRLLEELSKPVQRVEIRLWSQWERMAVGKWARIEEYLAFKKEIKLEKLRLAKKRQKVYAERVKRLRGESKGPNKKEVLASVEELEARAFEEEKKGDRMAYMRASRWWNQALIRRREIEMAKKKNGEVMVVKDVVEEPVERGRGRAEVELEVIRVGPNPRIVVCRYKLLAEELLVKLKVKSNAKFVRGMKIRMEEQEGEEWEYHGILPRHKGRW